MSIKGAVLPNNISSLLGREVYFRLNKAKMPVSGSSVTPLKLYTITDTTHTTKLSKGYVTTVIIELDGGNKAGILLGNLTCAHLDNSYYWSLKQLPATISLKDLSNG